MYFLFAGLNLLALGALFSNHRLVSVLCFFGFTVLNVLLLFQQQMTDLDVAFFAIQGLSVLVVFVALSSQSRDQTLTHQKKRASLSLLIWAIVLAVFFGHWFISLQEPTVLVVKQIQDHTLLPQGETFMLLAVVILWMVGRDLYDRK